MADDSCDEFAASPAQKHLFEARSTMWTLLEQNNDSVHGDYCPRIIASYKAAIDAGLPAEDDVTAKIGLASIYATTITAEIRATRNVAAILASSDTSSMLEAFESGAAIDRNYNLNCIAETWYGLSRLDMLFELKASVLAEGASPDAAEQFARKQLALVDHVKPTPLPRLTIRLGRTLGRQKKYEMAAKSFQDAVDSLSRDEASLVAGSDDVRREAIALRDASITFSKEPETTEIVNPTKKAMCFIATAAYGSAVAPEVAILSNFRDQVLLKSFMGRVFVRCYYFLSPPLARSVAKNMLWRRLAKYAVIKPALWLVRFVQPE